MIDGSEPPDDQATDGAKISKRDRLKGALTRTKEQIKQYKEERDQRKNESERKDDSHQLSSDVTDFLAAGRPLTADAVSPRQQPAHPVINDRVPASPLSQIPRRKPVPKIDVSISPRFPEARQVNDQPLLSGNLQPNNGSSSHLQVTSKPRSRSTSSFGISDARRDRIRGLSVGFVAARPVVIGVGGEDCDVPAIEISKARQRARSASPQSRRAIQEIGQPQPRHMPIAMPQERDYIPKPLSRAQTGDALLQPGPFATQTGNIPTKSYPNDRKMEIRPPQLTRIPTGGSELQREFDMTLGISRGTTVVPGTNKNPFTKPELTLHAPKPIPPPTFYRDLETGPSPPSSQPLLSSDNIIESDPFRDAHTTNTAIEGSSPPKPIVHTLRRTGRIPVKEPLIPDEQPTTNSAQSTIRLRADSDGVAPSFDEAESSPLAKGRANQRRLGMITAPEGFI